MNRRSFLKWANLAGLAIGLPSARAFEGASDEAKAGVLANAAAPKRIAPRETILLKDYRPKSIYKIPVTEIARAKFPVIDMHSHPYAKTAPQIEEWVKNMDEVGVEKTIILTMAVGAEFDDIQRKYAQYPERFEMWCGFDFAGYDKPKFGPAAIKELERCQQAGARGVGEIHDKGKGLVSGKSQPDIVGLSGMIDILERTAARHPSTTFVACHFANLDYDLGRLGQVLGRHPNLYADISARYAETAPIPRFAAQFYAKHADRLVYGTDMGFDKPMYRITFRILESLDEHFYEVEQFSYHWSLNGLGLSDAILKQVYHDNAAKLLGTHRG